LEIIINNPVQTKNEIIVIFNTAGDDELELNFIKDLLENYDFFNKKILKTTCAVNMNSTINNLNIQMVQ
jgi:hypothetical protein